MISITRVFEWRIEEYLQISHTCEWTVGEGPLYWYRIETEPFDSAECDLPPDSSEYVGVWNVLATSAEHLCKRLQEMNFSHKIKTVGKWTRPALNCDLEKLIAAGEEDCNVLEPVELPVECDGFTTDYPLCWRTEYMPLQGVSLISGDMVRIGQEIGTIAVADVTHLHFGIGDGQAIGEIGQTLDLKTFFGFPQAGARDSGVSLPTPTTFTTDEIDFIRVHSIPPVKDECDWYNYLGSATHSAEEYYAVDLFCKNNELNYPDYIADSVYPVHVACGGMDIDSEVIKVEEVLADGIEGAGTLVVIEHKRKGFSCPTPSFSMKLNTPALKSSIIKPIHYIESDILGKAPVRLQIECNWPLDNKLDLIYDVDGWRKNIHSPDVTAFIEWLVDSEGRKFQLFVRKKGKTTVIKVPFLCHKQCQLPVTFSINTKLKSCVVDPPMIAGEVLAVDGANLFENSILTVKIFEAN